MSWPRAWATIVIPKAEDEDTEVDNKECEDTGRGDQEAQYAAFIPSTLISYLHFPILFHPHRRPDILLKRTTVDRMNAFIMTKL